ncbi:DUF3891 family protein [Hymenobacter metallicola]|uniref:DUF3891 family protein n=1 Tax=Hymenobacter metallicola TaxID=2563114 RepID=A0A4Z0PW22_9BACT|nr:DUF3891 family protein [Hymenobacter metallicola]TGE21063.1 DUF3891 family protein [Hymenobacter metallicola]
MIVRETPTSFICIDQHDHAQISGTLAAHWQPRYFEGTTWRPAVELAAAQHDRAWIPLDAAPIWNEAAQVPHSFLDYPPAPKVQHYQQGIDEVAQLAPYAALLCSLHYTAFPDLAKHAAGRAFLAAEAQRQQQLKRELQLTTPAQEADLAFHLQLVKFTDNLSLYVCLNEPGVRKEQEYPWFRQGIPSSDQFTFARQQLVQAAWHGPDTVELRPSPFPEVVPVRLRYRQVLKSRLATVGLRHSLQEAPVHEQEFQFISA